jgi:NADP-dependent 3-hydroxy acid dehydrogenase YdfG
MASPKKTVLITGTSSGIGHALARELNAKGYAVLATARKTDSIKDLEALGITPLAVDVDSPASIAALKKEVEELTGGRLDMLINNAGQRHILSMWSELTVHRAPVHHARRRSLPRRGGGVLPHKRLRGSTQHQVSGATC